MNPEELQPEIQIATTHRCPLCGWEGASTNGDADSNCGFTSTIEGAKGDWCMKCWVRKTTKGVPRMEKINPQT